MSYGQNYQRLLRPDVPGSRVKLRTDECITNISIGERSNGEPASFDDVDDEFEDRAYLWVKRFIWMYLILIAIGAAFGAWRLVQHFVSN